MLYKRCWYTPTSVECERNTINNTMGFNMKVDGIEDLGDLFYYILKAHPYMLGVLTFVESILLVVTFLKLLGMFVDLWNSYQPKRLTNYYSYLPESYRAESPYYEADQPDCQFSVWVITDEAKTLIGHGVRIESWLVMPTHVCSTQDAQIVVSRRTKSGTEVQKALSVDSLVWKDVATDVSCAMMPDGFPLKKAVIGPYSGKAYVTITAAFENQNTSMSWMSDKAGFGMLDYQGSTRPGFSGAAYMSQKKMVAMHLGGGVQNLAIAASFLLNQLKTTESTEGQALERILRTHRPDEWDYAATGDPDYFQVRADGRYHLIETSEFYEILERNEYYLDNQDYYEDNGARRRRATRRRRDHELLYEPEGVVVAPSQVTMEVQTDESFLEIRRPVNQDRPLMVEEPVRSAHTSPAVAEVTPMQLSSSVIVERKIVPTPRTE